jgi:hypothetical protein
VSRGPHILNFNIRTGDGRLPPKKDTAMVHDFSCYFIFCVLLNFSSVRKILI